MSCMDETAARRLQAAAQEVLNAYEVQAATSPVGPRDADGLDRVVHMSGSFPGFRLALRGRVWTVEEDVDGEWVQRGGHFQDQLGAVGFLRKRVTPKAAPKPEPLTHNDVRAIVREEVERLAGRQRVVVGLEPGEPLLDIPEGLDGEPLKGDNRPGDDSDDGCDLGVLGNVFADGFHNLLSNVAAHSAGFGYVGAAEVGKVHEASPSVVDLGDPTVGDGQTAEGDPQPSAAEPPGPQVITINDEAVAVLGAPVGVLPALLILSHAEARALAADIIAATT